MSQTYLDTPTGEDQAAPKNFSIRLPRKSYRLRCISCEFKRSKAKPDGGGNNPMLEREWEVISPETVTIKNESGEDSKVTISGLRVRDWLTMTAKTGMIVRADSNRLGVEPPDDEAPNTQIYLGKEANAILQTTVDTAKDEETGKPILNSDDKPIVRYQHSIREWI